MLDQMGGGLGQLLASIAGNVGLLLAFAAAVAVAAVVLRLMSAGGDVHGAGERRGIAAIVVEAFTTNWQLTLLATTAFVLSIASGWTTWDGMRNFTGEPVLSLLITFGIQGVMLIIAWLIGESFAAGMGRRTGRRDDDGRGGFWGQVEPLVGMIVGALCAIGLMTALANAVGAFDDFRAAATGRSTWTAFADKALYLGVGLLVIATLLINQKSDVVQPYLQSVRVMARNAILWVMFLSCMATSVFFSFDSLFSSIFPQDERKRAADIRAMRQVAGAVADIGSLAQRRQGEEAGHLFQSAGWAAFEKNLDALSRASQGAEQEIERYFVDKMEAHRRAIAQQQERISSATSGQAGLASRKALLTDELSRLKGERPGLAAELAEKKTELENRNKAIDAKRVEAMAEERGAEGTLKVGKGPVYRQRMGELGQMQDAIKIQEERVRDATRRLADVDTRLSQIGRELAAVDGDIAKLKGEADTAQQRIAVAEAARSGDDGPKVDPARVRAAFERAQNEFRQAPTVEGLGQLATQCSHLLGAMASTPATKERVRDIDCDPKQAAEAAGRVFALNAGIVTFAKSCAGGDKLPKTGGTDAMLEFGRKCLQDAGLPSKDSNEMAARISAIDLNRDDKAHRFVVTWNAFVDGNRLAYLALAIAVAIDSLVFMSGLFGANALRSPLTEIQDRGEMTADQLEATIDATLGETPHPRATLSALLAAMHPVHGPDGFTSEMVLDSHDPLADEMRKVLVAGAVIGAVRRTGSDRSRYLVHSGLARYLAVAQKKPWKVKAAEVDRKELVNVVGVALLPDPQANAALVLAEMHPISDAQGFAAETNPFTLEHDHDGSRKRLLLSTLGAGATIPGAVKRNNADGRYFVSTDFYKTLLMMRAAAIPAFRPDVVRARYAALPAPGGDARASGAQALPTRLPSEPIHQLTDETRRGRSEATGRERRLEAEPLQSPSGSDPRQGGPATPASGPSVPVVPPPLPGEPRLGRTPDAPPPLRAGERLRPISPEPVVGLSPVAPEPSLGDDIRAEIIQHGGLHAWSDREIAIARVLGAESEPEQALKRLAARAPRLARLVGEAIDDYRASLREAYDYLRAHHAGNAMYNQVLETVALELDELMPILMLTPGGPYQQILDRMIYDLEGPAGEGRLSPGDAVLLERAKAQVEALKRLADTAADRYVRIVQIIDRYDERSGSGLPFEEARSGGKRQPG